MQFSEKPEKNVRNHRDIKLVTVALRKNYLVSEQNYHKKIFFFKKVISNRNEKTPQKYL